MTLFRAFRLFMLRWHRRIGVGLLLFVLLMVVSGIAINHSDDWQLDKKHIHNSKILQHYGIPEADIQSFAIAANWLSQLAGSALYFNEREIGRCETTLLGALAHDEFIVVLCEQRLQLYSLNGELLDDIGVDLGLPAASSAIALMAGRILLRAEMNYEFDPLVFEFTAVQAVPTTVQWSSPALAPQVLRENMLASFRGDGISVERFLLDAHSGRLFGRAGVLLVDFLALLLLLIAGSGVWVWMTKPGRWRR
ncbi:MAG: PepSY domain-containing protein [Spongiibacteraceae bacterium]